MRSVWRMLSTSQRTLSSPLDLTRAKADLHQLGNLLRSSRYFGALAFLLQNDQHARVRASDHAKPLSPAILSRSGFPRQWLAVVLAFLAFLFVFVDRCGVSVKSINPSTTSSILSSSRSILAAGPGICRDSHRTRGNGHDHVLQAFLDPLGDFDLTLRVRSSTEPISRMYMRTGSWCGRILSPAWRLRPRRLPRRHRRRRHWARPRTSVVSRPEPRRRPGSPCR